MNLKHILWYSDSKFTFMWERVSYSNSVCESIKMIDHEYYVKIYYVMEDSKTVRFSYDRINWKNN